MVTINKTLEGRNSLKKSTQASSTVVIAADILADLDVLEMFHIPKNSLITDVNAIIRTSFNPGTSLDLVGKVGATTVMAALDLTVAPGVQVPTVVKADSGAGAFFTLDVGLTGAPPTAGEVEITVEYVEYTKNNGELTLHSTTP